MYQPFPFHPPYYERHLTLTAASEQLEAGARPELNADATEALTQLLADPYALHDKGRERLPAAGLIWRLAVAHDMSHLVLGSVAQFAPDDPELLRDPGFTQGPAIARDLLQADPYLLRDAPEQDARAFWELVGYDPVADEDEGDPSGVIGTLEVLQDAAYIPDTVLSQMRHHRDSSSTMRHEPMISSVVPQGDKFEVESRDPDAREQELIEAAVRVLLSTFVATHTDNADDLRIATTAVEDFAGRAFTDITGTAGALEQLAVWQQIGVTKTERGQQFASSLHDRINQSLNLDLDDMTLADLTYLAKAVHKFSQDTPGPAATELLTRITAKLQEHETFYAFGDPHLTDPTSGDTRRMLEVAQAHTAQIELTETLSLLRGETKSSPTPQTVIDGLAANGFSMQYVEEAFKLVGSELDQATKARLTLDFDQAIGAALTSLPSDSPLTGPNALDALNGNNDLGMLARFPQGRVFIAGRLKAYAKLIHDHLEQPNAWINQQPYPDFVAARWIRTLHKALYYNLEIFNDSIEALSMLHAVQDAIIGVVNFIDRSTAQTGTLNILFESVPHLSELSEEALARLRRIALRPQVGRQAVQAESAPLTQLLRYYSQPEE